MPWCCATPATPAFARSLAGSPARCGDARAGTVREGLYGCSEMLVDGFLALRRAGVLSGASERGRPQRARARRFFLGNRAFYDELSALPPRRSPRSHDRDLVHQHARRRCGRSARNAAMHASSTRPDATLLGAASSDQLEDGRVISGVGGQGDFVVLAHALDGARSIIAVRARAGSRAGARPRTSSGATPTPPFRASSATSS